MQPIPVGILHVGGNSGGGGSTALTFDTAANQANYATIPADNEIYTSSANFRQAHMESLSGNYPNGDKVYFEFTISGGSASVGFAEVGSSLLTYCGGSADSQGVLPVWNKTAAGGNATYSSFSHTFDAGSVYGVMLDQATGDFTVYQGGVEIHNVTMPLLTGDITIAVGDLGSGASTVVVNYGQSPFALADLDGAISVLDACLAS
jgi:hypothetical protein